MAADVVERADRFLIDKLVGDNDRSKLKRMGVPIQKLGLRKSEFLFWCRHTSNLPEDGIIKFPLFEQRGKPYERK